MRCTIKVLTVGHSGARAKRGSPESIPRLAKDKARPKNMFGGYGFRARGLRPRPGMTGCRAFPFSWPLVRLHEQADDAGRALGAGSPAGGNDLGREFLLGQPGLEFLRLEIGRDQN